MPQEITDRVWTSTLLERQHLLGRVDEDVIEVLDRCVGVQSQDPRAPFPALAARIDGFDPADLDALLTDRTVVRMATLRGTVMLTDGEDARWIRALAQPTLDAAARPHVRKLVSAGADDVVAAARELLSGAVIGGAELGSALTERFPGENAGTLTTIARCALPLVQVPPRGLFTGSGAPTYALLDDWIGPGEPAVTGDEARKDLIRLYLRGFGPASLAAIQTWSGLTRLRPLLDAMDSDWEIEKLPGPDGVELFDLDGLDRSDAGDFPVRLLAPFDHVVTANADRRRVLDEDVFAALQTPNGQVPGMVLVDGRVVGTWSVGPDGRVTADLLRSVPRSRTRDLSDECDALTEFLRQGRQDVIAGR
ncbi:winged helix DNA-binding domain-containing protein [Williamsia deligens]|uniref:Winged helix DNA-binding domain-containing protein n=1 Tax=Williamsia deligens TaxID=321325 RepID=A0ABW3G6R6_9NOCA|nr:winged helix DNA-binding domain-containing protein [Williamsia deligens]MCP2193914.1 Winged helix DNA-binding domain-containing protein [Williamsia deligens]